MHILHGVLTTIGLDCGSPYQSLRLQNTEITYVFLYNETAGLTVGTS